MPIPRPFSSVGDRTSSGCEPQPSDVSERRFAAPFLYGLTTTQRFPRSDNSWSVEFTDLLITQYRTNRSETIPLDLGQKWQRRAIRSGMDSSTETLPYTSRITLLTAGERRFFCDGLRPAVEQRYLVSFKVRLADVIAVDCWRSSFGSKIAQKHLDFVLISPTTTRIIAAIELNDASHKAPRRQRRDEFVRTALGSAHVPFVPSRSIEPTSRR